LDLEQDTDPDTEADSMYSQIVMDHFQNPRNVGEMENPDGVGEVGNPTCGDMMKFFIKVEDDVIKDVKFLTFGCGAAIAVSSMVSEMAKGKSLDDALQMTRDQVADALGGLPKNKMHCSNLGSDALHRAIFQYKNKKYGTPIPEQESHEHGEGESFRHCPYCDVENPEVLAYCRACGKRM
jgi:nitrogen fixation NifU-like protein